MQSTRVNNTSLRSLVRKLGLVRPAYRTARRAVHRVRFYSDFIRFRRLSRQSPSRFSLRWRDRLAFLDDQTNTTGFDRHYIYHPAWAARVLAQNRPPVHVDISSSLHFVSLVSAFVPIRFYDYRPADLELSGLTCERADLLALPFKDGSVDSLSCMHVVEHVGLGRYGDPLDPVGDIKAMRELKRVLAPGGSLLFVVPVGLPVIRFNGHRIYSYEQIASYFSELTLQEFTLVPELAADGPPIRGAAPERVDRERYACGCFWFKGRS